MISFLENNLYFHNLTALRFLLDLSQTEFFDFRVFGILYDQIHKLIFIPHFSVLLMSRLV